EIQATIQSEETAFNKTLDRGIALFAEQADQLGKGATLDGTFAFKLYDTYGFPLDLTELMARERGIKVDTEGFATHMESQRAQARAAQKQEVIELSALKTKSPTEFLGFEKQSTQAQILETLDQGDA
ncbi:MAG: alanine--tRNA ligase-related protein, partial [Verrucomicrobiota bacterium]